MAGCSSRSSDSRALGPRLPYFDVTRTSPEEQALLLHGSTLMLKHVVAHAPGVVAPLLKANGILLQAGELPELMRELMVLRIAASAGSEYIWVQHESRARELGATDDQIAAV